MRVSGNRPPKEAEALWGGAGKRRDRQAAGVIGAERVLCFSQASFLPFVGKTAPSKAEE